MASNGVETRFEVSRNFIAAGCNRIVNNVSWGACDLVSFGAQNAVAIFCPKTAQIVTTLPGHKAHVNCTHWLPSSKFAFKANHLERHYLLSGDVDGAILLWEFTLADKKWRNVLQVPEAHKKGVTCIYGIILSLTDAMFVSTSSDGAVNVWEIIFPATPGGDCKLSCLDTVHVGRKPMVALSLMELPGNFGHLALAMGGLDNKIHIYTGQRTGKFVHACELKGHSDWIRSLDFSFPLHENGEKESLFLVSSSQDKGIRIWKMVLLDGIDKKQESSLASYIKGPIFSAGSFSYQISLESLLIGHEDWVYSVTWQPPRIPLVNGEVECYQPLSILSASMDKTMMIWQPEKSSGIWMNVVTVGELSHSSLGFYGCEWSPGGDSILAHGYGGSFHLWKNIGSDFDDWKPQKVPSGHFSSVSDISWNRGGEYLLSVSHDQTTRIYSPWCKESSLEDEESWHEIARPQVHGHDMNCVTLIRGKGNHRFVSGADEKVGRVFEAPLSFLKTLNHANSQNSSFADDLNVNVQILGANMSALGLSQKPIYVQASDSVERNPHEGFDSIESVPESVPIALTEPPIEEQLGWHTLWPESHKLYGHGNELFALCCDHQGKIVASSCKAQSASVAEIWLWQVGTWKSVGRLHSHSLTVTQLEFSHDNNFLLAVSRDRHFSIFAIKHTGIDEISHQLVIRQEAHKRIIWACSWNPFGHEFATGSRDKTVKIWKMENQSSTKLLTTLPMFKSSVTALSWVGVDRSKNLGLLAVGMESGFIELWSISNSKSENQVPNVGLVVRFDPFMCHVSSIHRLRWREQEKGDESKSMQLASCGDDHCVRIFRVDFV